MRRNTRKWTLWITLALVAALLLPALGQAQSGPNTMNFQGRLLDDGGNPRGGEDHCMGFRICTTDNCLDAGSNSTQVWPASGLEEHEVTTESGTYKAGLFTVALGAASPLPPDLMYNYDDLYLEINVAQEQHCPGSDWTTLEPRSPLRANAYAQRSRRVRTEESDDDYLVSVSNTGSGGGVYATTGSTTNDAAAGYFWAAGATGRTYGVWGQNDSGQGAGVRGVGRAPSGQIPTGTSGVWGDTNTGIGVLGYTSSSTAGMAGVAGGATALNGQTYGVWGNTSSPGGYGVYGTGPQLGVRGVGGGSSSVAPAVAVGVWGDSATGDGVWGVSDSAADQSTGVRGWANATSGATYGVYGYNRSSSEGARGVYGHTSAISGVTYGVYGEAASLSGRGVYGKGGLYGVYGEGTDPTNTTYGVWGQSTGASGYGVWGQSTHRDGVHGSSTNGNGVSGTTSSSSDYGLFGESPWVGIKGVGGSASSVATAGDVGVWGDSASGDGVWGTTDSVGYNSSGVHGWAKSSNGMTSGVWGYNDSTTEGARGVWGYAAAVTGKTLGVRGESLSVYGTGVYGTAPMTGTVGIATNVFGQGVGVHGKSLSTTGVGVYGYASAYAGTTYGVYGRVNSTGANTAAGYFWAGGTSGQTYGVYSVNNSSEDNAAAGFFWAKGTSGLNSGVLGANNSSTAWAAGGRFSAVAGSGETFGIWADNVSVSNGACAGLFIASGESGQTYGVLAQNYSSTTNATGVYGKTLSGATNGVWGETNSTESGSTGVYAHASNTAGAAVALWARSAGSGDIIRGFGANYPDIEFRVENGGDVRADGTFSSPAADMAELLPAVDGLEPGDVLVIGPDGRLARSSAPNASAVAGVYSTKPAFLGGAGMEEDLEGKVPLAVVGVVPVKVTAENGAIRPGDLLTTSSTPGHAMRAMPVEVAGVQFYQPGTIIGKALEGLDTGTGTILVLVTLQ